jgi:hypothetical protein
MRIPAIFLYQINRPRNSTTIRELAVNRLSKWSVGKFQTFVASETGIAVSEPSFTLRLETDINSSPEHTQPLPWAEVPALLREFIGLTVEITERGDVA